ncbi:P-loop NTPase family protein [Staphylococcus pseudintermedius]|uniref:AAA family ATPase n=1 Tax=Staphylococcus pseudintermedius TaxID=283734 RepID=UPI001F473F59|nr:AAA family ATPase [Staphylococcus pseudintermedius]
MYRRIVILGMPGSGKSTLCAKLGKALHIPAYHLDRYAWEGDTLVPAEVLQRHVIEIVKTDAWIMDGTYEGTLDDRLARRFVNMAHRLTLALHFACHPSLCDE